MRKASGRSACRPERRWRTSSQRMSESREHCHHPILAFGSGDYYLFCRSCDARWVTCGTENDQPKPELANRPGAVGLSGVTLTGVALCQEPRDMQDALRRARDAENRWMDLAAKLGVERTENERLAHMLASWERQFATTDPREAWNRLDSMEGRALAAEERAALASMDSEDAARFRWLCDDHDDRAVRHLRDSLIERMSVMSLSAVRAAIDIHLNNPSEPSHRPGTCRQCGRYLDRRGRCRFPEHNA